MCNAAAHAHLDGIAQGFHTPRRLEPRHGVSSCDMLCCVPRVVECWVLDIGFVCKWPREWW